MDKKLSPLKSLSIFFCIAAGAFFVMLLIMQIYLGGQMKTIDKLYNSISHGIYSDYASCFSPWAGCMTEAEFDRYREELERNWGEDFRVSADFVSRRSSKKTVDVRVDETTYNDATHETVSVEYEMMRVNGKWVIDG
ncbi:MAG: hypothetical protein IJ007_09585 [Oscillospiraceae bacterium]|nr:hypothetical protein [Oscillospiraceae bacterium]